MVDKTDTLTEGRPRLVSVLPVKVGDEELLLRVAASLERAREHPLAAAIVDGAKERGISGGSLLPAAVRSFSDGASR